MTREEWFQSQVTLGRLGYPSFTDYLISDRGQLVRGMVLARDSKRCTVCRLRRATRIRFTRFTEEDYNGETLDHIESICPECLWPSRRGVKPATKKRKEKRPHQPWSWTFHE